jgi:hypothetical protein
MSHSELSELVNNYRDAFRIRYGRGPLPDDPFFPEVEENTNVCRPVEMKRRIIRAMNEAGVDAQTIYVFNKTGIVRTTYDEDDDLTPDQLDAWDSAVNEYEDAIEFREVM